MARTRGVIEKCPARTSTEGRAAVHGKASPTPCRCAILEKQSDCVGGHRRSSNKILCGPRIVRDADAVKGERQAETYGDREIARTRSESDPVYGCILRIRNGRGIRKRKCRR